MGFVKVRQAAKANRKQVFNFVMQGRLSDVVPMDVQESDDTWASRHPCPLSRTWAEAIGRYYLEQDSVLDATKLASATAGTSGFRVVETALLSSSITGILHSVIPPPDGNSSLIGMWVLG